jgi:hypothetical protein
MPVVVYVAGARAERERVKRWANAVARSRTLELADRWFDSEAEAHSGASLTHAQALYVLHQYRALRSAAVFWLLWPEQPVHGSALVEYGYALAHRFHAARSFAVLVSGRTASSSALSLQADFRSDSDALGFDAVLALAQTRAVESAR